jgi:galactokinase
VSRTLEAPLDRRVRHVVSEVGRTREAARVLLAGDLPALGRLLVEGHESLRTDFESTVPEADLLVEAAVSAGAYGARLTGAGWGGSVIVLAPAAGGAEIVAAVGDAFAKVHGRVPRAWPTRPSGGVRVDRAA